MAAPSSSLLTAGVGMSFAFGRRRSAQGDHGSSKLSRRKSTKDRESSTRSPQPTTSMEEEGQNGSAVGATETEAETQGLPRTRSRIGSDQYREGMKQTALTRRRRTSAATPESKEEWAARRNAKANGDASDTAPAVASEVPADSSGGNGGTAHPTRSMPALAMVDEGHPSRRPSAGSTQEASASVCSEASTGTPRGFNGGPRPSRLPVVDTDNMVLFLREELER